MRKRTKTLLTILCTITAIICFFAVGVIFIVEKLYPLGVLFLILPFVIVSVSYFAVTYQAKSIKKAQENAMSDLHFTVKDKNGRHWGVSGDKAVEFAKNINNKDKKRTPEQEKQLAEFKDKMMEGLIDMEIKSHNGNMIVDVCFSDSICGELKLHLHKQYQEIISIPLFFDIGYLKDDALENQKENINNMYLPFGVSQKECDEIFDKIKQSIKSIVLYAQKGASFRIWNDNTPTSLCGFYYLINLLKDVDCKIYEMPFAYDCKPNLDDAEEVTAEQKQTHSCVWDLFVEENAPLRVFKNHILTSVPKTYYDDLILDIVDKKEMPVPKIVGEVLSKHKISDTYIFDRVYYLVEYGYLEITGMCEKYNQPNFYPYKHIVKRTGKVNAKEYRERLKKWSYDTLKLKSKILFNCSKETILKALELSTTIEDEKIIYEELKKLLDSEKKD